ncbi:MAG: ABC transporter substrate-binding protein [Ktedonobacterales bacterium]|nr:ABC transporter substrate-binding protein [Ktedonobacterales bacterium]
MMLSSRPRLAVGSVLGLVLGASLLLSACGSSGNASGPNLHLVSAGKLTIASDTTYAPAEYKDPNDPTKFIGYDMDLAREIARRLNLTANIQTATFDAIIPDMSTAPLGQQKYDMSVSSFTINDKRKEKVDMIPYLTAGESILVPSGNPLNIKVFDDMCGRTIAVQNGTVEADEVRDANGTGPGNSGQTPDCKQKGKLIKILSYDDQTVVVQQVLNGRADASYQDQPVTGYYVKLNQGKLDTGGLTVQPSPQGIVVRKDNAALETAITNALTAMRQDGTYLRILTQWGVQDLAYPK